MANVSIIPNTQGFLNLFTPENASAPASEWQSLSSLLAAMNSSREFILNEPGGGCTNSNDPKTAAQAMLAGKVWVDYCAWPFYSCGGLYELMYSASNMGYQIQLNPPPSAPNARITFDPNSLPYGYVFRQRGYAYAYGLVTSTPIENVLGHYAHASQNWQIDVETGQPVHLYSCFAIPFFGGWYFWATYGPTPGGFGSSGVPPQIYADFIARVLGASSPVVSPSLHTVPPTSGGSTQTQTFPGTGQTAASPGGSTTTISAQNLVQPVPAPSVSPLILIGGAALMGLGIFMLAAGE